MVVNFYCRLQVNFGYKLFVKYCGSVFIKWHVINPFNLRETIAINSTEYNYNCNKYDAVKNHYLIDLYLRNVMIFLNKENIIIDNFITLLINFNSKFFKIMLSYMQFSLVLILIPITEECT